MSHAQHRPFARLRLRRNLPAFSLLLFVTALATVLVPVPRGARAAGTTWSINPGAGGACTQADPHCATIQAAVDAASDGDTLQVGAGVYAEHVTIGKSLTINGAGAAATIVDGTESGTVFTVNGSMVSLTGMTIRNGKTSDVGGGIRHFSSGTLNLTGCAISNNFAGGGGAGIFEFSGILHVTDSTISNNNSQAIFLDLAGVDITDSTISNNSGGAIQIFFAGGVSIGGSTISGNDGGIASSHFGSIGLKNSIVAGNKGRFEVTKNVFSGGHNLIGMYTPTPDIDGVIRPRFTNGVNGDIVGTADAPVDPKLLPLGYYGGPTQTQPPRPSSLAIDAGDDSVLGPPLNLLTDQRGSARQIGPHVDIGAVEFDPAADTIDNPRFFVTVHYNDFLGRAPDDAGLNFWAGQLTACGSDAACTSQRRQNVSAAFFLSIEFQQTGYYVYRVYKAAYGDINPPQVPVPLRFQDFLRDRQAVGQGVVVGQGAWQQRLANNKQAFALAFVRRPEFQARYPGLASATAFVNSLEANAGGALNDAERSALISELSPNPTDAVLRADVLQKVAENALFQRAEFDRAFVLMQYFGYLRRNPDDVPDADFSGYNFWLSKLDGFGGNFQKAEMVKAFINSDEYRKRFTP